MASTDSRLTSRNLLVVALACVGSLELFSLALRHWTVLRAWEPWVKDFPTLAVAGPLAVIACASGLVVGLLVAVAVPDRATRVAIWAGLLACIWWFSAALVVEGAAFASAPFSVLAAPLIAIGMLLGAKLGRRRRHA